MRNQVLFQGIIQRSTRFRYHWLWYFGQVKLHFICWFGSENDGTNNGHGIDQKRLSGIADVICWLLEQYILDVLLSLCNSTETRVALFLQRMLCLSTGAMAMDVVYLVDVKVWSAIGEKKKDGVRRQVRKYNV